tara:strand:- start:1871 stop:2044 length:174 start_codon:yes stop_codon:yes gene_type:complete
MSKITIGILIMMAMVGCAKSVQLSDISTTESIDNINVENHHDKSSRITTELSEIYNP